MSILVINAGSSSMKFALFAFQTLEPLARGLLDWAGTERQAEITVRPEGDTPTAGRAEVPDYRAGVAEALRWLAQCGAAWDGPHSVRVVGHRLIHGGEEILRPVRIDAAMKETIARYQHLAPLHIPPGLEAIAATEAALPMAAQVGVFDTAFFAPMPPEAYLYPVPYRWYQEWGIRRFGFHGTSHAYCTQRATEMLNRPADRAKLIICHLGQGSSATAVDGGVAVMNTMGFTPLEGLMMGTRSGTVDPGILIHVQREHGLSVDQLDEILHKQSGLLGLSGLSSDFRQVEEAAREGNAQARLALDVYAHRVRATIGALTATLGGVDAVVFTGGIGEHSAWLRTRVAEGLECLGVQLDPDRNQHCRPDQDIAAADAAARVLVIHTREDYMIARQAREVSLAETGAG